MRGHGATVAGSSLKEAVFKSIDVITHTQMQPVIMQLGNPRYLEEEAILADQFHRHVIDCPWDYWRAKLVK